jgi:hypothetical protein
MAKTIKQKDINFLLILQDASKPAKKSKLLVITLLVAIVLAVGMAGFFLYATTLNANLQRQIEKLLTVVPDPSAQRQIAEAERATQAAAAMQEEAYALVAPLDNLATYPDLTSEDFRKIFNLAGNSVVINDIGYSRETGILTFNATCGSVRGVPIFMRGLRNSGIFRDVSYSGYTGGTTLLTDSLNWHGENSLGSQTTLQVYTFRVQALVLADQNDGTAGTGSGTGGSN